MNRLTTAFLKQYDPGDKELYLKARFVLMATLFILLASVFTLWYSYFMLDEPVAVLLTELAGFFVMLSALILLVKGHYGVAVHILLMAGIGTIWMVMFVGSNSTPITKMDTVVLVPSLLSAMPLMIFKNRRPMVVYFIVNMVLFFIFNYYLFMVIPLTTRERLDYFFDNSVALVFVFSISFTLFSIYQQVLMSLKKELEDRKKAEKALQESENQLSIHLRNTPVGAISWDLDFRVREWNPSAETIFGYSREEAIGKQVTDLILSEDVREQVNTVFQNVLAGRGGERNINENITKKGRRILCDWYNTVLKTIDGKITGVASLVNDITERKKTQEMIIQSEKMLSIGGLAAGMAHEINNPLAGMIQNAQVIHNRLTRDDLPANETAARELNISMTAISRYMEKRGILKQLDNITQAGLLAAKIIENMLSFSRKSDSSRKKVNLAELVNKTLDLAANDYNLKKRQDFKNITLSGNG